jgi:anti-anti-sigma regulatory factor
MSTTETSQARITNELIDHNEPEVVVIEFLSREIVDAGHAQRVGQQLDSLLSSDRSRRYILDFKNVRALGSAGFGEIANFVRKAGQVRFCNLHESLHLGAALIGLDDCGEFGASREQAVETARRAAAAGDDDDTLDYPFLMG